jgi:hypothetical protein
VDVRMGKPTQGEPCVSMRESIAHGRETGGTETSKYPKEKKETSIPQVAASERGRAQTSQFRLTGVRASPITQGVHIAKRSGKAGQRR